MSYDMDIDFPYIIYCFCESKMLTHGMEAYRGLKSNDNENENVILQ